MKSDSDLAGYHKNVRSAWAAQDLTAWRQAAAVFAESIRGIAQPNASDVRMTRDVAFMYHYLDESAEACAMLWAAGLKNEIEICSAGLKLPSPMNNCGILVSRWLPIDRARGLAVTDAVAGLVTFQLSSQNAWISREKRLLVIYPEQEETIEGPSFLLGSEDNYAHWLLDRLPCLAVYPNSIAPRVLIGQSAPAHATAMLRHLSIEGELVALDNDIWLNCEQLYFSQSVRRGREVQSWVPGWLRERFCSDVPAARRRLYVSRADASVRRILNEDELVAALLPLGFETVMPGRREVSEQARMFAQAEAVVGMHGAGLANNVFAPNGCLVAEILPAAGVHEANPAMAAYFDLAKVAGHRYVPLFSNPENASHSRLKERDALVDVEAVVNALKKYL